MDPTVAERSAEHAASWLVSGGDGTSRTEGFSDGCAGCVGSWESVGQKSVLPNAVSTITEAEFLLPLLVTARQALKSSFLASSGLFPFASAPDTSLVPVTA